MVSPTHIGVVKHTIVMFDVVSKPHLESLYPSWYAMHTDCKIIILDNPTTKKGLDEVVENLKCHSAGGGTWIIFTCTNGAMSVTNT